MFYSPGSKQPLAPSTKNNIMTKTAAIKSARIAVNMYKQGRGWIVTSANRIDGSYDYWTARRQTSQRRLNHAQRLLGLDETGLADLSSWQTQVGN